MKEKMMRIIVAVMLTLLLCSLTLLTGAASKNDWKNTAGCYVWTESSQYNNGVLNIKPLGDDKYLYELKVLRGSEEEDSAEDFVTAGILKSTRTATVLPRWITKIMIRWSCALC